MSKQTDRNRNLGSHVLSGSTTMIGVCITVIALFHAFKMGAKTYADELLAIDNFFFIIAALLGYASIRTENNQRLERLADIFFFCGMALMLVVGIVIVFTTY